jgi:hydroxyacylglutathione hydrolase
MWELYDDARSSEVPSMLFTGDFLFVGDVGRPDLLGKEQQTTLMHQLYKSIFEILPRYPDFVEIYPAHVSGSLCGKAISSKESSTLGYERLFNPALQKMPEEQWCKNLMHLMPAPPPYFKRMKQVNVEGPKVIDNPMGTLKALSPEELEQFDTILIDTRTKESFAALHIEGSFNVTYGPSLPAYAGCIIPYDKPIVLICDDKSLVPKVVTLLMSVGYDNIIGYLKGGIAAWEESGQNAAHTETITVHQLFERLKGPEAPLVIDVRADSEWTSGHIEGALHAPITVISDHLDSIPKGRPLVTLCQSGNRASAAASFLKSQGFIEISNVAGGMAAWEKEGLPIIKA